jgi:hypothetical protein
VVLSEPLVPVEGERRVTGCQDVAAPIGTGSVHQADHDTIPRALRVERGGIGNARAASDVVEHSPSRLPASALLAAAQDRCAGWSIT